MKIDFSQKKHLITSGCSFTDGFDMGEKGSWAYYLANSLNLELHNRARGGSGNEYIADSIIYYLWNNKHLISSSVVGIAWSDVTRLMSSVFCSEDSGSYLILDTVQPQDFLKGEVYESNKDARIFFSDILFCYYKSYMAVHKLRNFLDLFNIPYFFMDAISPIRVEVEDSHYVIVRGSVTDTLQNTKYNFSDYPHQYMEVLNTNFNETLFRNNLKVNGYDTIIEFMFTDYDKYNKGNPGHPNDIASKEIADSIMEQIL